MKNKLPKIISKWMKLLVSKQFTSIGGQAVIEGVMMRSPNAFVVAVRKPSGEIVLRKDQWFGLSKKFDFLKKPFFRGVLVLIETMANGIVSLNYSANIAESEEKGKKKASEKIDLGTFLSIGLSFVFGIGLFVFLPHYLTIFLEKQAGQNWGLNSVFFHAVDGLIKSLIFIGYIFIIGLIPDIKRVFQYHGAEHKSISTFEAGEDLIVENAKKYPTFHPRCGTTFVFFLLFVSIIIFTIAFSFVPFPETWPKLLKHTTAVLLKVVFSFPIAGIAYELIKYAGSGKNKVISKIITYPGMLLQKLTTREPDEEQLEVALASIQAVLHLEESFNLKEAKEKVVKLEEVEIKNISELGKSNLALKDFLEI